MLENRDLESRLERNRTAFMFSGQAFRGWTSSPERRAMDRFEANLRATVIFDGNVKRDCTVLNYNLAGARLDLADVKTAPDHFLLNIPALKLVRQVRVIWRGEGVIGVHFQ